MAGPSCTAEIERRLEESDSFTAWRRDQQTILQSLAGLPSPTSKDQLDLSTVEKSVIEAHACILSKQRELGSVSNQATQLQSDILSIQQEIDSTKEDTKVARDRVKYLRNPAASTSYYESWFPLQRPMKAGSVPILLGLSLFLIVFFFLSLLGMFGIQTQIALPERWFGSPYNSGGGSYRVPFMIVTGLLLVSIGISVYGFLRKK